MGDDGEVSEFFLKKNYDIVCKMEPDADDSGAGDNASASCGATLQLNEGK